MSLILLIFLILPQDYINLLRECRYEEAIVYCDSMIARTKGAESFTWQLERGDVYFNKLDDLNKADEIYKNLIETYPSKGGFWVFAKSYNYPDLGWIHLRYAQVLEIKEDFLNAAKQYEIVATQFRKLPLDSFALSGVERCFKKNYQDYVANIDGYKITRLELDERMSKASPFGKKDEQSILEQMILERLIQVNAIKYNVKEMPLYKENIKNAQRQILLEEVQAGDVIAKSEPTKFELKRHYNKNKKNYKLREEVRGKEIVVESDSLASWLLDTLKLDPQSFDTLAKLYSTAPSKNSGGNMGVVYKGIKPKEVEDVIFKTSINSLTNIVPADDKFGIYLITDHKPERYRSFEELQTQLESQVKAEKIKSIEEEFVRQLRKKAQIISCPDSDIVVIINGRKISKDELEKRSLSQPQFGRVDLANPEQLEKMLNTIIDEELKLEWAERNKYFLNDGYWTRLQDAIKKQLDQCLYTKVVLEAVSVDSQEIKARYERDRAQFIIPETVRCLEIAFDTKELAHKIRKILLQEPEKFDSLAKEYSKLPTGKRGGDAGVIRKGAKPKEYEEVAFKLKPNELSKVFKLDNYYYLLKLVEHNPETIRKLEEVMPMIETQIRREKQRAIVDEFLPQIRKAANIQILLPEPEKEELPKQEKE